MRDPSMFLPPVEGTTEMGFLALSEMLEDLVQLHPLPETLDRIARRLLSRANLHSVAILLPTRSGRQMRVEGSAGMPADYVRALNGQVPVLLAPEGEMGPSATAFVTGRVVLVNCLHDRPFVPWRGMAEKHGFRSLLAVPLRLQDRVIGVLNCYSPQTPDYTEQELKLVQAVAAQAALSVELARRLEEQQRTIRELEEARQTLERQRSLLERAHEIDVALTEQVLKGADMNAIAGTLARHTGKTTLVWDQFRNLLCAVGPEGVAPARAPAEWQRVMHDPRNTRRLSGAQNHRGPILLKADQSGAAAQPILVAPVVLGPDRFGHVGLVAGNPDAGELDMRALHHGAAVLALDLMKRRIVVDTEERIKGELVEDLVLGRYQTEESALERGRFHGADLQRPHRVMVIELAGGSSDGRVELRQSVLDAVRKAAVDVAPGSLLSMSGDRMALVFPVGRGFEPGAEREMAGILEERVRPYAKGTTVSFGLGGVCSEPREYRRSYREGRECIRLLRSLGRTDRFLQVEDLGVFATLLFNVRNPRQLVGESAVLLAPLLDHDRDKGGDLIRTLERYLDCSCDLESAARDLFVHPNTVKYRLQKIGNLTGKDLKNPYDLLHLALSAATLHLPAEEGK